MIFKQFYYDTQPILSGKTAFFTESDANETSIKSLTEDEGIKWLFQLHSFREWFAEDFFPPSTDISNIRVFFGLRQPFTSPNNKPGDIDLLLVNKERPEKAIAFECKRVKVTSTDRGVPKVNNANKVRGGIIQANGLQSLGFYKSYLLTILLDDSRMLLDYPNTMMRNCKSEDISAVYDIPHNEHLNNDVGVVYVRVTQPTGNHYNNCAGVGFCIDHAAQEMEQLTSLTNKIRELLKSNKL